MFDGRDFLGVLLWFARKRERKGRKAVMNELINKNPEISKGIANVLLEFKCVNWQK